MGWMQRGVLFHRGGSGKGAMPPPQKVFRSFLLKWYIHFGAFWMGLLTLTNSTSNIETITAQPAISTIILQNAFINITLFSIMQSLAGFFIANLVFFVTFLLFCCKLYELCWTAELLPRTKLLITLSVCRVYYSVLFLSVFFFAVG